MRRRRDSVSVMPRRTSASAPGRTDDYRNEEGTSDLEVTAGRVARCLSREPRARMRYHPPGTVRRSEQDRPGADRHTTRNLRRHDFTPPVHGAVPNLG